MKTKAQPLFLIEKIVVKKKKLCAHQCYENVMSVEFNKTNKFSWTFVSSQNIIFNECLLGKECGIVIYVTEQLILKVKQNLLILFLINTKNNIVLKNVILLYQTIVR